MSNKPQPQRTVYDYVIIGSGFGGSVSAMRLAEKGYAVLVLERGKSYRDDELPKSNWNFKKYLWMPVLRCFGILQLSLSRGLFVYHGCGVGGGSLVYAAALMEPSEIFYDSPAWNHLGDWKKILAPYFNIAKYMLGINTNPYVTPADEALKIISQELGLGDTYRPTEVGIFFGEPDIEVVDPYFNGEGPARVGCTFCGACMVGCRKNSKNTLNHNYLYFAKKLGVEVLSEYKATGIYPLSGKHPNEARYEVAYQSSTGIFPTKTSYVRTRNIIISAGVLGSLSLLLHCRDKLKTLNKLSPQLGHRVRTNSEVFMGAFCRSNGEDHSKGIAISSLINADKATRVEIVRFSSNSSLLYRILSSPLLEKSGGLSHRVWHTLLKIVHSMGEFINIKIKPGLARRGVVLMLMQTEDNQMQLSLGKNPFTLFRKGLIARYDQEYTSPISLMISHNVIKLFAKKINAIPYGTITEGIINVPMTAHILGGCVMGQNQDEGVVDIHCQVHGYEGLYVVDGSIIPANLGINPSLTITALAEYAMSFIPYKNT